MPGKVELLQAAPPPVTFTGTGRVAFVTRPGDGPAPTGLLPQQPQRPAPRPVTARQIADGPDAEHDTWARTIAQREASDEFLTQQRQPMPSLPIAPAVAAPTVLQPSQRVVSSVAPDTDLTGLPTAFSLQIERTPDGWWKIRAPEVHVGLFVAHQSLHAALSDVPQSLAKIVRLDGIVPAPKRKKGNATPMQFVERPPAPELDALGLPDIEAALAALEELPQAPPKPRRRKRNAA